jgi:hypothetical protein
MTTADTVLGKMRALEVADALEIPPSLLALS